MPNQAFVELLTDLHRSIDRVARDLERDRPALARVLRQRAARIPRPEEMEEVPPRRGRRDAPAKRSCRRLPPLLYHALDEGVLDARQFDALMLGQARAARALRERRP